MLGTRMIYKKLEKNIILHISKKERVEQTTGWFGLLKYDLSK